MKTHWTLFVLAGVCLALGPASLAGIRADLSRDAVVDFQTTMDIPFMTVGNMGNAGEMSGGYGGSSALDRICGAVDYIYWIGKFEVTAGQYTEFLNAVAATDTYGLYSTAMPAGSIGSCGISRSGTPGNYTYSVLPDWEDRPVTRVGWGDSARFANWVTNGMPTGAQDASTTEDGSYVLNGAVTDSALMAVVRTDTARFVIPSEDEWYKAAYHANDGVTGNYWDYPTATDTLPSNQFVDPDPGNHANFVPGASPYDYTIGSPYYFTEVGEFEATPSPYGAFDMGGNVGEWTEGLYWPDYGPGGNMRRVRGGSFGDGDYFLLSDLTNGYSPTLESGTGFRVAFVPEPATLGVLALGGMAMLRRRRR